MARIAAGRGSIPFSMWREVFSTTTMASCERPDQRDRNGGAGNQGRPPVLEEHEDHEEDQQRGLPERGVDLGDRVLDEDRRVEGNRPLHVLREVPSEALHGRLDLGGQIEGVCARELVDRDGRRGLSGEGREEVVVLGAELHASDVAQTDDASLLSGLDDDLLELP
jgi:hypothetical protein